MMLPSSRRTPCLRARLSGEPAIARMWRPLGGQASATSRARVRGRFPPRDNEIVSRAHPSLLSRLKLKAADTRLERQVLNDGCRPQCVGADGSHRPPVHLRREIARRPTTEIKGSPAETISQSAETLVRVPRQTPILEYRLRLKSLRNQFWTSGGKRAHSGLGVGPRGETAGDLGCLGCARAM